MFFYYFYSLNPVEDRPLVSKDTSLIVDKSSMESVLSLDDGRWLHPTEDSNFQFLDDVRSDNIPLSNLRQPSPPPVLAQLQQEFRPISPSKVADPRPGPAKCIQDVPSSSNSFQHLHVVSSYFILHYFGFCISLINCRKFCVIAFAVVVLNQLYLINFASMTFSSFFLFCSQ